MKNICYQEDFFCQNKFNVRLLYRYLLSQVYNSFPAHILSLCTSLTISIASVRIYIGKGNLFFLYIAYTRVQDVFKSNLYI